MKALRKPAGLTLMPLLVISLSAAVPAIKPSTAQAGLIPPLPIPNMCSLVPDGAARSVCKVATDPIGTAAKAIGLPTPSGVIDDVAQAIVQPILNQIARAESDAVVSVLKDVSNFVNNNTIPNLTVGWFLHLYAIIFGLAIPIGLFQFYGRSTMGIKNQDLAEVGRAFVSLMSLIALAGLIPGVVGLAINALDNQVAPLWMTTAGASANNTLSNLGVDFSKSISFSNNPVTPILLPLIFLFVGLIGGLLIELMLLFREAMLYLVTATTVVYVALAVGGPSNVNVLQRQARKLAVLCSFKVIVAFILTIGLLLLGSSGASPVLMGSVVLLMVPILSWRAYTNWAEHDIRFLPGGWGYTKRFFGYVGRPSSS